MTVRPVFNVEILSNLFNLCLDGTNNCYNILTSYMYLQNIVFYADFKIAFAIMLARSTVNHPVNLLFSFIRTLRVVLDCFQKMKIRLQIIFSEA